ERHAQLTFKDSVEVAGVGAQAPPDKDVQSPETYVGYERADSCMSAGGLRKDSSYRYTVPDHLELNQWGLSGDWTDRAQLAALNALPGKNVYRFHARDLHLVLGTSPIRKPVRFRVKIDGKVPGADHGGDTDGQGNGSITEHRLYQLIRQKGA